MIIFGFLSPAAALPPLKAIRRRGMIMRRSESALHCGLCQERGIISSLRCQVSGVPPEADQENKHKGKSLKPEAWKFHAWNL